jgi:hypothetical protein
VAACSAATLRIVGDADEPRPDDLADGAGPPLFIGPDYARLRRTDWGRLHAIADARDGVDLPAGRGQWRGTDARRFER